MRVVLYTCWLLICVFIGDFVCMFLCGMRVCICLALGGHGTDGQLTAEGLVGGFRVVAVLSRLSHCSGLSVHHHHHHMEAGRTIN